MLDAVSLESVLSARWPTAIADGRATADETHQLAIVHPRYDGFLSMQVTARCDLAEIRVRASREIESIVTMHHRVEPMQRGQRLPIDIELHPGNVGRSAVTGRIEILDEHDSPLARPMLLTVATDAQVDCTLAGALDGPFESEQALDSAITEMRARRAGARRLARRIERMADGHPDPGWSMRTWWPS